MVVARAHSAADSGATASFALPAQFPELCDILADELGLQRSSLTLRSKHAASPQDTQHHPPPCLCMHTMHAWVLLCGAYAMRWPRTSADTARGPVHKSSMDSGME